MHEMPKPTPEHGWLDQLVGEWTIRTEMSMGPDQPMQTATGQESVRSLGGFWVVCNGEGEMPDGDKGYMIMTLGYSSERKRYIGNWVGSMMGHMWVYDGELVGNVLTLNAEGPSMLGDGSIGKYQDIVEIIDANTRTLSSQYLNPDGTWNRFMTATYTRK